MKIDTDIKLIIVGLNNSLLEAVSVFITNNRYLLRMKVNFKYHIALSYSLGINYSPSV